MSENLIKASSPIASVYIQLLSMIKDNCNPSKKKINGNHLANLEILLLLDIKLHLIHTLILCLFRVPMFLLPIAVNALTEGKYSRFPSVVKVASP